MVTKDVLEKLLVAAVLKALGMNRELDVISFNRTIFVPNRTLNFNLT